MSCKECKESGMCQKKSGLPILLTRYAIGPCSDPVEFTHFCDETFKRRKDPEYFHDEFGNIAGDVFVANKIFEKSDFKILPDIQLGDGTYYCVRPLLCGFVYVFDEMRYDPKAAEAAWQAYRVTSNAFMEPLPKPYGGSNNPEDAEPKEKPCQAQNYAEAGYITVKEPVEGEERIVWIVYSSVEWSKDVWERHAGMDAKGKEFREKHMRKFDVKQWLATHKQDHAAKIGEIEKYVVDFAKNANDKAFSFSPSANKTLATVEDGKNDIHGFPLLTRCGGKYTEITDPNDKDHHSISQLEYYNLSIEERNRLTPNNNAAGSGTFSSAQMIISVSERIRPNDGAIVALDDPVGITRELTAIMDRRIELLSMRPSFMKGFAANANIIALEPIVCQNVKKKIEKDVSWYHSWCSTMSDIKVRYAGNSKEDIAYREERTEFYEKQFKNYKMYPDMKEYFSSEMSKAEVLSKERIESFIELKQDEAWKKHEKHLTKREKEREAFNKKYKDDIKNYTRDIITPIAKAHAQWLESSKLADFFKSNFSTISPEQGGAYPFILAQCIGDAQDKSACQEVLLKWMRGKVPAEDNLLLRALVLNQDKLAKVFKKHDTDFAALMAKGRGGQYAKLFQQATDDNAFAEEDSPIDAKLLDQVGAYSNEWYNQWKETLLSTEEVFSKAYAVGNSDNVVALAKLVNADKASIKISDIPHTISAPIELLFKRISGVAGTLKDEITPFHKAVNIVARAHVYEVTMTGAVHQHLDLFANSFDLDEKYLADDLIANPSLLTSGKEDALLEEKSTKGLETLSITAIAAYIAEYIAKISPLPIEGLPTVSLTEKAPPLLGEIKSFFQTATGKTQVSVEARSSFSDSQRVQHLYETRAFFKKAHEANILQYELKKQSAETRERLAERRASRASSGSEATSQKIGANHQRIRQAVNEQNFEKQTRTLNEKMKQIRRARAKVMLRQRSVAKVTAPAKKVAIPGYSIVGFLYTTAFTCYAVGQLEQEKVWGVNWANRCYLGAGVLGTLSGALDLIEQGNPIMTRIKFLNIGTIFEIGEANLRKMRVLGRILGVVGSGIAAAVDFWEMYKEGKKGNFKVAALRLVSATLNLIAMYCIWAGAGGLLVAVLLVALSFVITKVAEWFQDPPTEDYLEKCEFGNDRDDDWTEENEYTAFQAAVAEVS